MRVYWELDGKQHDITHAARITATPRTEMIRLFDGTTRTYNPHTVFAGRIAHLALPAQDTFAGKTRLFVEYRGQTIPLHITGLTLADGWDVTGMYYGSL